MRSLSNILPSVKFPIFGNVTCFSCFTCFFLGKKRGKFGEKLLDKNGLYILRLVQVQFGWLKRALGRIRVPKPRKSSVVASVWNFHLVSACALYYQQGEGTAVV